MMKIKLAICFWLSAHAICFAQDSLSVYKAEKASFDKRYFKSYLSDTKDIFTTPFHWKAKDWMVAGAALGLTSIAFWKDEEIRESVLRHRNEETAEFINYVINPWGNLYSFTFIAFYYVDGVMFENQRTKKVAMESAKALIITAVFTKAVKTIVHRERPYQESPVDPDDSFNPFETHHQDDSFFSGHTATAFTLATILSQEYKEKKWVPYVTYGIASAVGYGRIYLDNHWTSDVIAGAIFGYYVGRVIHKNNNWGLNIEPYSSRRETGLKITYALK